VLVFERKKKPFLHSGLLRFSGRPLARIRMLLHRRQSVLEMCCRELVGLSACWLTGMK